MEDQYSETHHTWDKLAQRYEELFMELELYNDTYQRFCELLPGKDATALELGCGPGNITRRVLDINPGLKILATDVSENMIRLAKKNNPEAIVQVKDCRDLSTIDGMFGGIICGFVIPYLSAMDCQKLIADCSSKLTDDGVLYLSFVAGDYQRSGFVYGSTGDRTYFYFHEFDRVRQDLETNGLVLLEHIQKEYTRSETLSETHTILIAQKRTEQID